MGVATLWMTDFRCFADQRVELDPGGLTVLQGPNGAGKSSVLEAVLWLASGRSWRTAAREALVRAGAERAVVRAELAVPERVVTVEADIPTTGTARTRVNRQPLGRRSDMADVLRVVLFAPDDLSLVHGGPAGRRQLLDEVLASRHPGAESLQREVDRTLRQRGALLQQAGGRLDDAAAVTLDVWDERLGRCGQALADARRQLVAELGPLVDAAHQRVVPGGPTVSLAYRPSWEGPLGEALARSRADDLRRRVTGAGPHRDDVEVRLGDRPARTQASQGEQRSVALALRLGSYHLALGDGGLPPVLLLDDVFSELDDARARALVGELPRGQVLLTTAVGTPAGVTPDRVLDVRGGAVVARVA